MFWVLAAGVGAACIGIIAGPSNMSRLAHPPGRLIADLADGADYVDSYSVSTRHDLTIADVDRAAIQRGRLVERSSTEIVYEDHAPGLRFLVGYSLFERQLAMTTVVQYLKGTGRRYFAIVRPAHRTIVPWVIWWTARRAGRLH